MPKIWQEFFALSIAARRHDEEAIRRHPFFSALLEK